MSEGEEWPATDLDVHWADCDRCGDRRPVKLVFDPFVTEGISEGPAELHYWCKPCHQQRCDDR